MQSYSNKTKQDEHGNAAMKTHLSPDVPRASHKAAQEATPANDLPHEHTQSKKPNPKGKLKIRPKSIGK